MANLNKVLLIGNLTRDPELRYTPGGTPVCDIGLATNRRWRNQEGEMQEETTFVDIVVWGRQGENVNKYLSKGRPVFVEGRLQLDTWETQDGQRRNKLRVVADTVQFLGGRGEGEGGGGGGGSGQRGGYQDRRPQESPDRGRPEQGRPAQDRPPAQSRPPEQRSPEPGVQEGPPDDDFNLDDIPF